MVNERNDKNELTGFREAIGRRMRSVRERLGETQAQFAARLGVIKLSVWKYEAGVTCPSADQMCLLSSTGVDASYVALGFPSLDTAEARRQFASALAWVKQECRVSSLQITDEGMIDAAWLVFCELSQQQFTAPLEQSDMSNHAKAAAHSVAVSVDDSR